MGHRGYKLCAIRRKKIMMKCSEFLKRYTVLRFYRPPRVPSIFDVTFSKSFRILYEGCSYLVRVLEVLIILALCALIVQTATYVLSE